MIEYYNFTPQDGDLFPLKGFSAQAGLTEDFKSRTNNRTRYTKLLIRIQFWVKIHNIEIRLWAVK